MSRKLLFLAFVLAAVGAACAQAPVEPQLDAGGSFVAAVVDPLNDAGHMPSVAVVDGRPYVAYFSFEEEVPEGSFPQTRPIGSPSVPGVMLATVQDGVWTRGAIAIEDQINNVQVAFNPAFEASVGKLTPQSVTGLQLVADADGGLHAVWGSADGVFYASGSGDPASTAQWTVERIARTPPFGPSLTLDGTGKPWVAYMTAASTADVVVATSYGSSWSTETIATGAGCEGCRTAIAVTSAGDPVVAYGDGADVSSVVGSGDAWTSGTVERGGAGVGLAAAVTPDGSVALSYATGQQVHVASGDGGGPWTISPVADTGEGSAPGEARTTGVAVDEQGAWTVGWYDPGADAVAVATSADGRTFEPLDVGLSTGAWSPAVATTVDGSTGFVAWYASEPQDLILGAWGEIGELAIAVPSPTPTEVVQPSGAAPPTEECTPVVDGTVTVVAEGIAFTDGQCIEAPAGEPFTIVLDNRDAGVQHNIQVFEGPEVAGSPTFSGELITGPSQIEYQIPALEVGEYAYNCLVHPNMVGSIKVVEPGGAATGPTGATGATGATGGGGGGAGVSLTVVAQNIAFDTSTITLTADVENTITLDNRDAGVPHNIAIYTDPNMSEELFNGELITGPSTVEYTIPPLPAGEYYFVCIVHPNMNGTVIVQ